MTIGEILNNAKRNGDLRLVETAQGVALIGPPLHTIVLARASKIDGPPHVVEES